MCTPGLAHPLSPIHSRPSTLAHLLLHCLDEVLLPISLYIHQLTLVRSLVIGIATVFTDSTLARCSYFVPILKMTGAASGGQANSLFMTGMYSLAKFLFTLMASFFLTDALGNA